MTATTMQTQLRNNPYKVAIASMVGTAIEFYDYYIYATAAVLVFNTQFFDKSDKNVAILLSLSTLALAFFARPIGSALFGHFGDKIGRRRYLLLVTAAILVFGLCMPLFLTNGTPMSVLAFLLIGMVLMGMTFGPMAALLPELFPTEVRYSGASLAYNLAAIVGASIATMVAIELNLHYGIFGVGAYLAVNCVMTLIALWTTHETKDVDLTK